MLPIKITEILANFLAASVFSAITWLYIDALQIRIEIKSVFRALGFLLLTITFALNLLGIFVQTPSQTFTFWIQSTSLWLMYVSFIIDSHAKLQILSILAIVCLFLLKSHALLSLQAFLIAISVLQISYSTKHKDLIPLVTGFFFMTIAELFFYLEKFKGYENLDLAANLMYIFCAIAFFYWLWSYLVIRFNLKGPSQNSY